MGLGAVVALGLCAQLYFNNASLSWLTATPHPSPLQSPPTQASSIHILLIGVEAITAQPQRLEFCWVFQYQPGAQPYLIGFSPEAVLITDPAQSPIALREIYALGRFQLLIDAIQSHLPGIAINDTLTFEQTEYQTLLIKAGVLQSTTNLNVFTGEADNSPAARLAFQQHRLETINQAKSPAEFLQLFPRAGKDPALWQKLLADLRTAPLNSMLIQSAPLTLTVASRQ